jgi:hypothetical protein
MHADPRPRPGQHRDSAFDVASQVVSGDAPTTSASEGPPCEQRSPVHLQPLRSASQVPPASEGPARMTAAVKLRAELAAHRPRARAKVLPASERPPREPRPVLRRRTWRMTPCGASEGPPCEPRSPLKRGSACPACRRCARASPSVARREPSPLPASQGPACERRSPLKARDRFSSTATGWQRRRAARAKVLPASEGPPLKRGSACPACRRCARITVSR